MAKFCGKDLLIGVGAGEPLAYTTVAAMTTTSMTLNAESVDVTDKGSANWREILAGCGINTMELSAAGKVTDDAGLAALQTACIAGTLLPMQVISGNGDEFTGLFKITTIERSGEYNQAEQYSLSLASAGAITFTPNEIGD